MKEAKILQHDPLRETDSILRDDFYGRRPAKKPTVKAKRPRPTHYKVMCISMYTQDIEALEEMVAELKRRGHTKANKSQLIRFALRQVDIDKLPPAV